MVDFSRFLFRASRVASNMHLLLLISTLTRECFTFVAGYRNVNDEKGKITCTVSNNLMRGITEFRQPLKTFTKPLWRRPFVKLFGNPNCIRMTNNGPISLFSFNRRYGVFQSIYSGLRLTEGLISWKRSFQEKSHYFSNRWWTKRRSK